MSMTKEEIFQSECESHLEALRELIEKMPEQGTISEYSQKVNLRIQLHGLEAAVNGVAPFDFVNVNMEDGDLELKDTAETLFNDEPEMGLYEVEVWFNAEDDTTTAVDTRRCLICSQIKQAVEAMKEDIAEMLNADEDLFVNIGEITTVQAPQENC